MMSHEMHRENRDASSFASSTVAGGLHGSCGHARFSDISGQLEEGNPPGLEGHMPDSNGFRDHSGCRSLPGCDIEHRGRGDRNLPEPLSIKERALRRAVI